jgi:putative tricarboxylic transport membrane protein
MLSSLVSLLFGLAVGAVGLDPMYGVPRLTFGSAVLENGISFVVVLIGMFAISEVLNWIGKRDKINVAEGIHASTQLPRPRDIFRLKGAIARGAGIGAMIGAVPGAGAVVGAVISYGVEKQSSKDRERFGQGVEAGLAAPETAKNATTGTATIPLLTLGIPGSAATAIMLAALVVQGVQPGPMLFVSSADLVYTVFAGYLVANFLMIVVGLGVARGFAQIIRIPPAILFGFIVVLCVVGAFGLRNNIADVYICVAFGLIGYVLQRFDIPSAPLVLGVILGPLAERYFRTAMIAADNDITIFVRRPYSGTILALSLGFMIWALWPSIKRLLSREQRAADGAALSRGEPEQVPKAR